MTESIEAVFDGEGLRPAEPLEFPPNPRARPTLEIAARSGAPVLFLRTARALALSDARDWSSNLEAHLLVN